MASGTFWTEQRPTTRRKVAQVALRDLLLTTIGWAAGAVVVVLLAPSRGSDGLGVFVPTIATAIALPLGLLALIRRDVSWLRGRGEDDRPAAVWAVVGVSTGQAATTAMLPYLQDWTAIQAWTAFYPVLVLAVLIDATPKLARPTGWAGIRAGHARAVPMLLLVGLLSSFVFALFAANAMITAAPSTCDPTLYDCIPAPRAPSESVVGPLWFGSWSVIAVAMFALRLRFIALAGVAMAYLGYAFWAQEAWRKIHIGGAVVADQGAFVGAQLLGALALIAAVVVVQIHEPRERTRRELRVLGWLGAGGSKPTAETPAR